MKKMSLLNLQKSWIYPIETVWKQKKSFKKPLKTPTQGIRRLFLAWIPPPAWCVSMNFESSRSLIKEYMMKSWWKIRWRNSHGRDFKKISWWMATQWSIRGKVRCWILKLIPHTGKINFMLIFIVFINHKTTCCRAEELHILNDIGNLDNWSVSNFS